MDSDSSLEDTYSNSVLQEYNTSMSHIADKVKSTKFEPLKFQHYETWQNTDEDKKRECINMVAEGCRVVCGVVAPNASKELFEVIFQKNDSQVTDDLKLLMCAYRDAPSKNIKTQILSLYAYRFSATKLIELHEPYECLTRWQIKQARKHAKMTGPGTPVEKCRTHRVRLPLPKVDHFLDFINRPYYYQDVAYGTRVLKLDSGEKIAMPNTVRTVTRTTMISQYIQFCDEDKFVPLSRSTLFKILEVREASQRKSLQGLDNAAADGAVGFATLERIIDELQEVGVQTAWCAEVRKQLRDSKQYFKTKFRLHCTERESCCPDHCAKFALSDDKDETHKERCDHVHSCLCRECETLKETVDRIHNQICSHSTAVYCKEQSEDFLFDFDKAKVDIFEWKAHIMRSMNQEKAKQEVIHNLKSGEVLMVMDWAMKFTEMKFREKQSEWFGKRGMSWHVSSVISKPNVGENLTVQSYVHLFDSCRQDWFSVASILEHLLQHLKSNNPRLNRVFLRSDEAGCYHNNFLMAAIQDISHRVGVSIISYDFSEPNFGKDICDRIICPLKTSLKTYVNEGNDICSALDMYTALQRRPVRGTSATVCQVDESLKSLEMKKIDGFSKYHNFQFSESNIRVWKAHRIGRGKSVDLKLLVTSHQGSTGLHILKEFFEINQRRDLKAHSSKKEGNQKNVVFQCTEPNCSRSFQSFYELEQHLDTAGCHNSSFNESVYDDIRRKWAALFTTVQEQNQSTHTEREEMFEGCTKLPVGWALHKTRGGSTQFSSKVRKYLTAKFDIGEQSGHKADPHQVSLEMRNSRDINNEKLFTRQEWLTRGQIKGFFSRLAAVKRRQKTTKELINPDELIMEEIQAEELVENQKELLKDIHQELALKHPIYYDAYNLCAMHHSGELSKLNIKVIRLICSHLEIYYRSRALKGELVKILAEAIEECSCFCNADMENSV